MFGQTFESHDLILIGLLVILEGVLSIDNALVLGLLAKRLPKDQQKRALTYGLAGAFIFRLIAVATATLLMQWWWVKLVGGGYLVYIAVRHLFFETKEPEPEHFGTGAGGEPALVSAAGTEELSPEQAEISLRERTILPVPKVFEAEDGSDRNGGAGGDAVAAGPAGLSPRKFARFWPTVLVIELTDIAFAIDSILAAIALAPRPEKLWVVLAGGMMGVMLMRVAAIVFIRLLAKFPRLELSAYLLVIVIGVKLLLEWGFNKPPPGWPAGTPYHGPVDFHSPTSIAFWSFWGLMVVALAVGFLPSKKSTAAN